MVSFVALYCGRTLSDAELVGVSIKRDLINKAAADMLADLSLDADDPVAAAVRDGRRRALQILREEATPA